jgi:hypothetical protein
MLWYGLDYIGLAEKSDKGMALVNADCIKFLSGCRTGNLLSIAHLHRFSDGDGKSYP